jgi:hypothetical protein
MFNPTDEQQVEESRECEIYEAGDWSAETVTVQTLFGPITYIPRRDDRLEFSDADERAFKDQLFGLNSNRR